MTDFSVNTNPGSFVALQSLSSTNKLLERTQLRVTTGLKVNGPKDDAATFAIAQNQRGDIAGFRSVKTALAAGGSTTNVAITGGKSISDLLIEMKAKVVQANQAGLNAASRTALQNDFAALRSQIETIVATAEFNGANLITSAATNLTVLSTVDGSTISVSAQSLDTNTLGISTATVNLLTSSGAVSTLTAINAAIVQVSDKLAALGSAAKRIEVQSEFVVKLVDILQEGVGTLVDANMAEESAALQSLQVKQQLGIQALAIANSNPQAILQLFRG